MRAARLVLAAALALPAAAFAQVDLAVSEYFRTAPGSGTITGTGHVQFLLSLDRVKPLPTGAVITVEYEDPAAPSRPVVADYGPPRGAGPLHFESRRFRCADPGRTYHVTVRVFAGARRRTVLSTHVQPFLYQGTQGEMREFKLPRCKAGP